MKQKTDSDTPSDGAGDEPTITMAENSRSGPARSSRPVPALVVHSGPSLGDYFPFPGDATELQLGRARDMDFVLRHASVSRNHVKITIVEAPDGKRVEISDQGSTNGTQVNGADLAGSRKLCDGDMLQIGEIALRYRLMDPAEHAFQDDIARRVESARTDPLTGLLTRRFLVEQLPPLMEACRHNEQPFSILIIDLDYFKSVNDRYGHLMGDQVLCQVAKVLKQAIRAADTALRFGGEEFCIVLPGAPTEIAMRVAERVRRTICELTFEDTSGQSFSISTSVGVAEIHPGEGISDWLERADRALYVAKEGGRDRVTLALEPDEAQSYETVRRSDHSASTRGIVALSTEDLEADLAGDSAELAGSMSEFARSYLAGTEPDAD